MTSPSPAGTKKNSKIRVRPLERSDKTDLIVMGARMRLESSWPLPEICECAVSERLNLCITQPGLMFGALAHAGPAPIGFAVGGIGSYPFSDIPLATLELWYVTPEWRGTLASKMLLEAFSKWAANAGALQIHIGLHTGVNAEKIGYFLKLHGFTEVGKNYRKQVW